jgi:hypothetical protein
MKVEGWYERLLEEYREIEATASWLEGDAKREMDQGNPRNAQVYATLAVSARLEALSYSIRELARD